MFKFFYIIIVFCFLQLISIQLKADKFQVESFTKDEKDIAARKAELKDINDDYCAIIKVRTNVDGILLKLILILQRLNINLILKKFGYMLVQE